MRPGRLLTAAFAKGVQHPGAPDDGKTSNYGKQHDTNLHFATLSNFEKSVTAQLIRFSDAFQLFLRFER